ncbi:unnamed protein product [Prunus armeniaca]|uniref:Protein LURP-one-related 15 n=1 Tax=Prunus armeniaca TaxID=36596 RepID=A0A6J5VAN0_PRUAR|nr:unnamed protein product [Prunus armeniaca]CAB4315308.1 unnamed protein product [Prunus armeniaca]
MTQPEGSAPSVAYAHPAVAVVSPHFCSPYPVDIAIVRKLLTIAHGKFEVTDVNGNIILKVKGDHLLDAAGYPIITLRQKLMSAHDRWQVFRGESTKSSDLIFSTKRSSMVQFHTKLDVFLAHNTTEKVPDFKVKGSWSAKSCVIYAGDDSTIVAQMHKKRTVKSELLGKDHFMVTVYPGNDYAFIVALIVILDEIITARISYCSNVIRQGLGP